MNGLAKRVLGAIGWLASCARSADAPPVPLATATLQGPLLFAVQRAEEHAFKQQFDPRTPPDGRALLGPDPTRIARVAEGVFAVTLARTGEVALFDRELRELDRTFAVPGALAMAADAHGTLWVGSPTHSGLAALRVVAGKLERLPAMDRGGFASIGLRDLTARAGCLYGVDEHASELVSSCGAEGSRMPLSARPIAVAASEHYLVVTSAVGHTESVYSLVRGAPRTDGVLTIENDGPFFGAAMLERADGSLVIASGGVENHPLDRRGGSFGYIDSFVYIDSVERGALRRLAAIDVGELGVITPKALVVRESPVGISIDATSYGSSAAAHIELASGAGSLPSVRRVPGAPGVSDVVDAGGSLVGVSPLLDALVRLGTHVEISAVAEPVREAVDARLPSGEVLRLGEALFYTNAMGPYQRSEGELSRFTCESCHFEGGIDGRVHRTGRGEVVATTKPLFGLGNNGPHFTRALDDDLTEMVFAEFRVAAANSGHSEWFALDEAGLDWLSMSDATRAHTSAAELRRALVLYLASLPHAPNPRVAGRSQLSPLERRGASLFAAECEGCHQARLVTNEPESRLPLAEWESAIFSASAPIVWARDGYEKTGIVPYVHDRGARPSSLRRIVEKSPYFTNGSARTLGEVLSQARVADGEGFQHAPIDEIASEPAFDAAECQALEAFLRIL